MTGTTIWLVGDGVESYLIVADDALAACEKWFGRASYPVGPPSLIVERADDIDIEVHLPFPDDEDAAAWQESHIRELEELGRVT